MTTKDIRYGLGQIVSSDGSIAIMTANRLLRSACGASGYYEAVVAVARFSPDHPRPDGSNSRASPQLPRQARHTDGRQEHQRDYGGDVRSGWAHEHGRGGGHHPVGCQLVMVAPAVGHVGEIEKRDAARQPQRWQ
jgi:hypothetical protein